MPSVVYQIFLDKAGYKQSRIGFADDLLMGSEEAIRCCNSGLIELEPSNHSPSHGTTYSRPKGVGNLGGRPSLSI
jgi:hypothetical protein